MHSKRIRLSVTAVIVLGAIGTVWAGGWSVTTVDALPQNVVAGEPFAVGFVVRQHGVHVVYDLQPVITATGGPSDARFTFAAVEDTPGHYAAVLTLPAPGTWQWSIAAFGPDQPMPALQVAAAGQVNAAEPPSAIELGAALYVAKGCAVCHRHGGVVFNPIATINAGPDLTQYRGDPHLLRAWLADPAALKSGATMPALGLGAAEIEALIAFLNETEPASEPALPAACGDGTRPGLHAIRALLAGVGGGTGCN